MLQFPTSRPQANTKLQIQTTTASQGHHRTASMHYEGAEVEARSLASGSTRQNSSLPHKCGGPNLAGTPHLCGRKAPQKESVVRRSVSQVNSISVAGSTQLL